MASNRWEPPARQASLSSAPPAAGRFREVSLPPAGPATLGCAMPDTVRELCVLYVEWGPAQREEALLQLQRTLGRIFPGAALAGRVIDTSGTSPSEPVGPLQVCPVNE